MKSLYVLLSHLSGSTGSQETVFWRNFTRTASCDHVSHDEVLCDCSIVNVYLVLEFLLDFAANTAIIRVVAYSPASPAMTCKLSNFAD